MRPMFFLLVALSELKKKHEALNSLVLVSHPSHKSLGD